MLWSQLKLAENERNKFTIHIVAHAIGIIQTHTHDRRNVLEHKAVGIWNSVLFYMDRSVSNSNIIMPSHILLNFCQINNYKQANFRQFNEQKRLPTTESKNVMWSYKMQMTSGKKQCETMNSVCLKNACVNEWKPQSNKEKRANQVITKLIALEEKKTSSSSWSHTIFRCVLF